MVTLGLSCSPTMVGATVLATNRRSLRTVAMTSISGLAAIRPAEGWAGDLRQFLVLAAGRSRSASFGALSQQSIVMIMMGSS